MTEPKTQTEQEARAYILARFNGLPTDRTLEIHMSQFADQQVEAATRGLREQLEAANVELETVNRKGEKLCCVVGPMMIANGRLVEACKKALTCASINSDVRELLKSAIDEANTSSVIESVESDGERYRTALEQIRYIAKSVQWTGDGRRIVEVASEALEGK